jgi:TolC family type I secretion outer membrane protein
MMLKRLLLLSAAFAVFVTSATAETLNDAMQQALDTNPTIEARRSRLDATREALPQARAGILPALSVSAGADATRRDGGGLGTRDDEGWSASASASQLLFASGSVAASVKQARARIAGAEADYVGAVQQLLLDVTSAYAGLREASAIVDARQKTAQNLEAQTRYARARFDAGVSTRTDLAQAEARLAQARTQLIQAQGSLAAANETYRRIVGAPAGTLAPAPRLADLPASLDAALALAVQQSPTLVSARAAEVAADAAVSAAGAARGPRISLEAGSSLAGDFRDATTEDSTSDSVGLRFSVPLFTGGAASSRTREQRALRQAAALDRVAAERQVRESVTTAFTAVDTARAAYTSAQEQVTAAETALRGVTLEQDVGLRATVEVLDQENDLLTARLALAAAERELAIAERRLLLATGELTEPK